MKYDLKILQNYIDRKLINIQLHPTLPLRIYKYSQECVFSRSWDNITLNMRGTVIDNDGNLISNPFPKFFNLEELEPLGISLPNLPYKVYNKLDGSLIEVFRYNKEIIVSSSGSFVSDQAIIAENMLKTKYSHLLKYIEEGKTYLFELIFPKNRIVVNYGDEEKLVLLTVRELETGKENDEYIDYLKKLGFDVVDEIKLSLDELKNEIKRPDFINKEGFVVKFENGFRVKMKYAEYFRLHKVICNINEKFIWEFMSKGLPLDLSNVPDETFQYIRDIKKSLQDKFDENWSEANVIYKNICLSLNEKYGKNNWNKKDYALMVIPTYKKLSGVLFNLYDNKIEEAKKIIWKMIQPKSFGFQSMKTRK